MKQTGDNIQTNTNTHTHIHTKENNKEWKTGFICETHPKGRAIFCLTRVSKPRDESQTIQKLLYNLGNSSQGEDICDLQDTVPQGTGPPGRLDRVPGRLRVHITLQVTIPPRHHAQSITHTPRI